MSQGNIARVANRRICEFVHRKARPESRHLVVNVRATPTLRRDQSEDPQRLTVMNAALGTVRAAAMTNGEAAASLFTEWLI